MDAIKSIFESILASIQVICLVVFGFQPAKTHQPLPEEKGPVNVLVTGLLGYGENVGLSFALPYFGTQTQVGVCDALEERGYESYVPDLGPISSAWDRACELYAILTGTRVDYGEAHSREYGHERYGHERYGRDYAKPLFEGWGAQRQVNLISHSFGGATSRVFAMLCDEGSAAEREATPAADRSPLFDGGLLGGINAIVTLASPHNGSTAAVCISDDYCELDFLWLMAGLNILANERLLSRIYDLQLDHFHVSSAPSGPWEWRDFYSIDAARKFLASFDHAFYDLSLDGAAKINKADKIRPGVKYLSYSTVLTDDVFGYQLPPLGELLDPVLLVFALQMGLSIGNVPDDTWRPNDGAVPLPSALYPDGQPHQDAPASSIVPGVWNVMPTIYGVDHAYLAGGDPVNHDLQEIMDIYMDMLERINP